MARYGRGLCQPEGDQPARLVYCSITGFGQTGPYPRRAGFDYAVQGMGGLMSVTGPSRAEIADDVPAAAAESRCRSRRSLPGLYACTAILAALRHRDSPASVEAIDIALLDTQVADACQSRANYLTTASLQPHGQRTSEHRAVTRWFEWLTAT